MEARCDPPWLPFADIKGPAERWRLHDDAGRKPVLLSRALVIDNAIALPQVAVCVRVCVFAFQDESACSLTLCLSLNVCVCVCLEKYGFSEKRSKIKVEGSARLLDGLV